MISAWLISATMVVSAECAETWLPDKTAEGKKFAYFARANDHFSVLASESDHSVIIDRRTNVVVCTLIGDSRAARGSDISSDGACAVTTTWESDPVVWDAKSGTALRTLKGHVGVVYQVMFSPDGKYIVTAGKDNTARIWSAATGRQVFLITGPSMSVMAAMFSEDGNLIEVTPDTGEDVYWIKGVDAGS